MAFGVLSLGVSSIVDSDLLLRVVELPCLPLILYIEVYDEEWMLKFNEEVAHVRHLFGFFLVSDHVKRRVEAFVGPIDLIFQLFFGVATRDVLDTEIGSQVLGLFDKIDQHWLVVLMLSCSVIHRCRACVLRARC